MQISSQAVTGRCRWLKAKKHGHKGNNDLMMWNGLVYVLQGWCGNEVQVGRWAGRAQVRRWDDCRACMTGKIWNKICVRGHPGAQVRNDSDNVSLHMHTHLSLLFPNMTLLRVTQTARSFEVLWITFFSPIETRGLSRYYTGFFRAIFAAHSGYVS